MDLLQQTQQLRDSIYTLPLDALQIHALRRSLFQER